MNNNTQQRWVSIPRAFLKQFGAVIGPVGIAAYAVLAAHADSANRAPLSYRKLGRKLGCTYAETIRALHHLEDLHLIRSEFKRGERHRYRLLWTPPWGKAVDNLVTIPSPYRIDIAIKTLIDDDIERLSIKRNNIMNDSPSMALAYELAEALNDKEAIQMYISYTHRFPEALLREILARVLSLPGSKIRKTRGALFNYLIQQHAAKTQYYPGD